MQLEAVLDFAAQAGALMLANGAASADVVQAMFDITRTAGVKDVSIDVTYTQLTLFHREVEDLPPFLLGQDAIYVGGGNTLSLLAVWRAHGVDVALRACHEAGVVLGGLSAGSICWFESGTTDSYGPTLQPLDGGLGLVRGSHSPHYDGEAQRRPTYQRLVGSGRLVAGLAVDDGAAAVHDGPSLVEVVASAPGRTAYRVEPDGQGGAIETALPAQILA